MHALEKRRARRFARDDFESLSTFLHPTGANPERRKSPCYKSCMMNKEELKSLARLTDDELLRRLSDVLAQSRRVESVLVAHIGEVDARRLFARETSPSMFQYCIDVLHLSKAEAYHRITAARASREHPMLLAMLEDGRLHLSGISVLAPHLTKANCDELLTRAIHQTKDAIKELVAEIAPKPDVPSVVRKLPSRQAPASACNSNADRAWFRHRPFRQRRTEWSDRSAISCSASSASSGCP